MKNTTKKYNNPRAILFFLATNIAFMATMTLIFWAFSYLFGLNLNSNLIIGSAIIGFSSALFSLFTSKWLIKRQMHITIIQPNDAHGRNKLLSDALVRMSKQLGITPPELGVYVDPIPNAFATGWSKNSALVAFSTGLLNSMTDKEIEAVMAHELSHVVNGDMVGMALIQGIANTLVIAVSRVISSSVSDKEGIQTVLNILLQTILGFATLPIVLWFSRQREYRADKMATNLVGNHGMIKALEALKRFSGAVSETDNKQVALMGIRSAKMSGWFSTHPTLDQRINRLASSLRNGV